MKYKTGFSEKIHTHYTIECEFCELTESSDIFEKRPDFYRRLRKDGWRTVDSGLEVFIVCPDCVEKMI